MNANELDTWGLIKNGQFLEAKKRADAENEKTKNILSLRNKVFALLHLGEYEACLNLTNELIVLTNGETDSDFIYCGLASWLLNRPSEAIEIWMRARNTKYTDAAGGVELQTILYYAAIVTNSVGLKDASVKCIKKILKGRESINWPGALGNFLLGELNEGDLISKVSNVGIMRARQLCQAYFVIATKNLEEGIVNEHRKNLEKAISFGESAYLESMYYFAKGELERV